MKKTNICIGTAQFGMHYGITNKSGKLNIFNVKKILESAKNNYINLIDTAQSYGDAEHVLGSIQPCLKSFNIINKLPAQKKDSFELKDIDILEKLFFKSLEKLNLKSIHSFLLHSSLDLHKPGSIYLKDWLLSLKERSLVHRLGISIYHSDELHEVPYQFCELVQLPLSIYDQRFLADGTIKKLRDRGSYVHARSLFLQGLLLNREGNWPNWINEKYRMHHLAFQSFAENLECSLLDLALAFAADQEDVEAFVIGFSSFEEFSEFLEKWNNPILEIKENWNRWAIFDNEILDPRNWPSKKHE